jgi:hypothetical protein
MLRLVRPSNAGQGTRPPKGRPAANPLTNAEQQRVRAALRNLRALYGSWSCLSSVMGVARGSLENVVHGVKPVSAAMALRAARAAGKPLDALIGAPCATDRCPRCGRSG